MIPEYRDFKNGKYIYSKLRKKFIDAGFTKVIAEGTSFKHIKYLKKLDFKALEGNIFVCNLV